MATLYKRPNSPYWWIKFRDSKTGKLCQQSTGERIEVANQSRRARAYCAALTNKEFSVRPHDATEDWVAWVPATIHEHHGAGKANTLYTIGARWKNLALYFEEKQILGPRQLDYKAVVNYRDWRLTPDPSIGKRKAGATTARTEIGLLSWLLDRAVHRGFVPYNVVRGFKMKRDTTKRQKPEFSDADINLIQEKILLVADPARREFLANSFEIACYQGCRLAETLLNPQTDVTLDGQGEGSITFVIKGGGKHETALHPALVPLFSKLKESGRTETYVNPDSLGPRGPRRGNEPSHYLTSSSSHPVRLRSTIWIRFLAELGLRKSKPGVCFHSFRVTAITRLARAKVPIADAMRFIGHSSQTVHMIYQRLGVKDLNACTIALQRTL